MHSLLESLDLITQSWAVLGYGFIEGIVIGIGGIIGGLEFV